jgi:hypothetical protein
MHVDTEVRGSVLSAPLKMPKRRDGQAVEYKWTSCTHPSYPAKLVSPLTEAPRSTKTQALRLRHMHLASILLFGGPLASSSISSNAGGLLLCHPWAVTMAASHHILICPSCKRWCRRLSFIPPVSSDGCGLVFSIPRAATRVSSNSLEQGLRRLHPFLSSADSFLYY